MEVGQDVFHTVVMTGLVDYLFDETGGDGHGTVGRVSIIPKRKMRQKDKMNLVSTSPLFYNVTLIIVKGGHKYGRS